MVGYRDHEGGVPKSWYGTAWLRQALRLPGPLPAFVGRNAEANWSDRAAVSIRALRWLQEVTIDPDTGLADISLAGVEPFHARHSVLRHEVRVYRWPAGYLAVLPRPRGKRGMASDVTSWVQVIYAGRRTPTTTTGVTCGEDWTSRPPRPPRGAELIVIPGA